MIATEMPTNFKVFYTRHGQDDIEVGVAATYEEADVLRRDYLKKHFPDLRTPYLRGWKNDKGEMIVDFGSWTDFFKYVEFPVPRNCAYCKHSNVGLCCLGEESAEYAATGVCGSFK